MRRSLAGLVSLALIVAAPPPSAWAQFAEAARSVPAGGASPAGASAGAARLGSGAALPVLGLSSLGALAPAAAPAASFTPSLQPALRLVAPAEPTSIAVQPLASVTPSRAPDSASGARIELAAAVRALAAPDARPATALDRLFIGGVFRAAPAVDPTSAPPREGAPSLPAPTRAPVRFGAAVPSVPVPADAPPERKASTVLGAAASVGRAALAAAAVIAANAAAVAAAPALFAVAPVAAVWAVSSGLLLFPAALYARYRLARRDSPRLNKVKVLLDLALGAFVGGLAVAFPSLALAFSSPGFAIALLPAAGLAAGFGVRGAPFMNSVLVWGALGLTPLAVGAAAIGGLALGPILGMLALPAMTTVAFFLGGLIAAAETGSPFAASGFVQKMRFPSFQWVMIGVVFALLAGYSAAYANTAFLAWRLLGSRTPVKWDKSWPLWKNLLNKAASFDALFLGLLAFTVVGGFTSPLTFLVLAFSGERVASWTERLLARFLPRGDPAPSTNAVFPEGVSSRTRASRPWPLRAAKTLSILAALAGTGMMTGLTALGFHSLLMSALPAAGLVILPLLFAARIIKFVMRDKPADEKSDPEYFAVVRGLRERINAKRRVQGRPEIPMPELVDDPLPLPNAYASGRDPSHAFVAVTSGLKEMTLDPENVREGVARLIGDSDFGSKAFKTFRLAISGSIGGVTESASAADVQAAVLKADRAELKALGTRMLAGVLGHELAHVMDRHTLSAAITGAVSASIAFASYGAARAAGRAQAGARRIFDGFLGRSVPEPSPEAGISDEAGEGVRKTLLADPISLGAAVKSLPALLKLFAALWAPVVVQIVQTASSRGNESIADEDGALLGEDPQSLALALGLMTSWRPKTGAWTSGASLPRIAALSFMMTVNPLEQAAAAGAPLKLDAATEAVVGSRDEFLAGLFVTHPAAAARIERLSDMAEARRAAKPAPALVSAPQGTPAPSAGGVFRGGWEKLKRLYRVLPDESRNRAFWVYTIGQALATLGINFYDTALPNLIAPTKADTPKLGYNRAANSGAQAASSPLTGPFVDRHSARGTLAWTHVGRGLLMALVPVLFATGYFGFAVFSLVIAAAGFLQTTGNTAGSVAFNRILGEDEAYYNRANAIQTITTNAVGVAGPLLAGVFIAWAGSFFALPLMGYALAYGVDAALLLAAGVGYGLLLKLPRDGMLHARRGLKQALRSADLGGARVKGVESGRLPDGRPALVVEASGGDPARMPGMPKEFAGYPVTVSAPRSPIRELIAGFKLMLSNRFLRLYMGLSTLSFIVGDSLVFTVLPRFLADVLKAGPGAFGLFLAAAALGLGVASILMTFAADPAQTALAPVASEFRAALAARDGGLDAGRLDRAAVSVRGALAAVLERYKTERREGRGRELGPQELAADVLAQSAPELGRVLEIRTEEAAALLEATGAARDVRLWAARRGSRYTESVRRDARSGMDSLQRQAKWSNVLHAASWLAYAGVFFMPALWPSVGLMLVSSLLSGPANIIWASLTTRVVAGSFPNDQGKVYSAMTFYMLGLSVVGVLGFGWLMAALPTASALLIVAAILGATTIFDLVQTRVIFPLGRR